MYYISAVYIDSNGFATSTQINDKNKPYESPDFDFPMRFHSEEQAKEWTESFAAAEWDLGFCGYFDIWEATEYTLKELDSLLKEQSGVGVEDAMLEFLDSYFRQGKSDKKENITYFLNENSISLDQYNEVSKLYDKVLGMMDVSCCLD